MSCLKKLSFMSIFISFFSIAELSSVQIHKGDVDTGSMDELGYPITKRIATLDFNDNAQLEPSDIKNLSDFVASRAEVTCEIVNCNSLDALKRLPQLDPAFVKNHSIVEFVDFPEPLKAGALTLLPQLVGVGKNKVKFTRR